MVEGTELSELLGRVFDLLIGPPLSADEIIALDVHVRSMYLLTEIKTCQVPLLYDPATNTTRLPLFGCVHLLHPDLSGLQVGQIVNQLEEGEWINLRGETARLRKSDNVTHLQVAWLIYNEGGWVKYGGDVHHRPRSAE